MFLRLKLVLLLTSGVVLLLADTQVFCVIQESPPEEPASVQEQTPKPTEIVVPPSAPRRSHRNPPAVNNRSSVPALNPGSQPPLDKIIPEGTVIEARLAENVSTKTHQKGDHFELILDRDIEVDQKMIVPKGTILVGRIVESVRPGKVKGQAEMCVVLDSIRIDEYEYPILTNEIEFEAEATKGSDAKAVGISAGIGAALGAIFGGKKGAAVGAAGGAGAGTAGVLLSRGREIELEKERLLSFRLEKDLELEASHRLDP